MFPRKTKEGKANAAAGRYQDGHREGKRWMVRGVIKNRKIPFVPQLWLNKALPHLSPGSAANSGDAAGSGAATPQGWTPEPAQTCGPPVPSPRAKEPGEVYPEPALCSSSQQKGRIDQIPTK